MVYLHGVLGSLCTLKLMLAADELEGKCFSLHFLNITERRGGEEREAESLVSAEFIHAVEFRANLQ